MYLKRLEYAEFGHQPREWLLDKVTFGDVNLIVGKNSSGKTRMLNVIRSLAALVSGRNTTGFESGTWVAEFERQRGSAIESQRYSISYANRVVVSEEFKIKESVIINRNHKGEGQVQKKGRAKEKIKYKVPLSDLMAVARLDQFQHPQFSHVYKWGASFCLYRFGSDFGKSDLAIYSPQNAEGALSDFHMSDHVENTAIVFQATLAKFGARYKQLLIEDLNRLDYSCVDVFPIAIDMPFVGNSPPTAIAVQESALKCPTVQGDMSQGMYRALAILIQFNANILWTESDLNGRELTYGDSPMIVIDDIGEGLDHARSKLLISLLMEKALGCKAQLIMSSNDRYVMNYVPLEYWTVLHRVGSRVKPYNNVNAKQAFEEFEYSGLSNFDFFAGGHFLGDSGS